MDVLAARDGKADSAAALTGSHAGMLGFGCKQLQAISLSTVLYLGPYC